jgi:RNA polymerase sigma-70 factor (ECF subfamily)
MAYTGAVEIVLNPPRSAVAEPTEPSAEVLAQFHAHGEALYRFARAVVREPHEAEDVVQTVFLRLLAHLKGGGNRSNLRAWLFAVAANLCRDHFRRQRRWVMWLPEHDRMMTVPPDLTTADPQELFLATMRKLSPRDRLLVGLKAQGLSYREIAAAAGLREASVGRLLARAMARWQRTRNEMSND